MSQKLDGIVINDLSKIDNNKIFLEDWLEVSSPSIRISQRNPKIVLPNSYRKSVNTSHTYFRINNVCKPGKEKVIH